MKTLNDLTETEKNAIRKAYDPQIAGVIKIVQDKCVEFVKHGDNIGLLYFIEQVAIILNTTIEFMPDEQEVIFTSDGSDSDKGNGKVH